MKPVQRKIETGLAEAYRERIIGKMKEKQAQGATRGEIERCLEGCVMAPFLIRAAGVLWIQGRLTDQDVRA